MITRQPSPDARFKAAIYDEIARIGKATASPARLAMLDVLSQGPRTVEDLASQLGQSLANTSHHLQVLRRARLVDAEKSGLYVTYRLADPQVGEFFLRLRGLAQARLGEIERVSRQYWQTRGALEPIDKGELQRRVRSGLVTVIDVRPRQEYVAGHLPGAISMPLSDLRKRLGTLPKHRDVVAYCRGPYCVMALDAVELLRRKGFRAERMEDGVPEWRAHGWPVETGP